MIIGDAVAHVESRNDPAAIRFEPSLYHTSPAWVLLQVEKVRAAQGFCSHGTALMIACTSWGVYQILGANLYSLGYKQAIIRFANDINAQKEFFNKFCTSNGLDPSLEVTPENKAALLHFASVYNGPGNPQPYADALLEAAA